jgi:GNAT superfamily N-acetyltransferase
MALPPSNLTSNVPIGRLSVHNYAEAVSTRRHSHDTLDLVADLAGYQPPADAGERAASAGISLTLAGGSDLADVVAFEAAVFPQWVRWFSAGQQDILIARDSAGNIAATLLMDGPGADTVLAPMLGPAAGTIGCVGVAPPLHGRGIGTALLTRASQILGQAGTRACHIGWTTRETFYRRAGYHPWRRYAMFRSLPNHAAPSAHAADSAAGQG